MKGVIAGIHPTAQVVDITHEIPPGDLHACAFALRASYRYFPARTVHVVVVDPGVGSRRRAIAVEASDHIFIAPDNGVLSWVIAQEQIKQVCQITNDDLFLKPVSRTFHGRDIFAPVAAQVSQGMPLAKLGPKVPDLITLPWPAPRISAKSIQGEIVYIDHYGNAITNLAAEALDSLKTVPVTLFVKDERLCTLEPFYQAVPVSCPAAIVGSSGFLEIAVNGGSAARKYHLRTGDSVTIRGI